MIESADLEDVVQVVRDQDHGEALLAQARDEVEHLLGLRHAERGGRLVEDHDACEFHITALATATDWRWPPESPATVWRTERIVVTERPVERLLRPRLHRRLVEPAERRRAPRARGTCSGRRRGCRPARGPGRRPRCRARAASFGPWMLTGCAVEEDLAARRSGGCPAMHLISVDLPAPLSPTSAMTSPGATWKSTSKRAWTAPKLFETPRSSRTGASVTSGLLLRETAGRPRWRPGSHRTQARAPCTSRRACRRRSLPSWGSPARRCSP